MTIPKLSTVMSWLMLTDRPPGLAVAQMAELQRQMPLLYALLLVNAAALAYTHVGIAPAVLTFGVPVVPFVVCVWRIAFWLRNGKVRFDEPQALAHLRRTTIFAGVLSVSFVTWALALDAYGGGIERGHVALFIAITVIGCIFCLMHLPQAAMVVTVTVTAPYLFHYLRTENAVFAAMAVNIALVTAVMVQVLVSNFAGFAALVRSKSVLAAKQAETQRLSQENERLAQTCSLTQLPNRRYFFAELDALIARSAQADRRFVVGILDLDRFKPVNDTYGHVFGDRLLSQIGDRLRREAGDDIIVARLGGDEFGFLFLGDADEAQAVGQRICDRLSEPLQIDDIRVAVGCSCGVAIYPDAGATAHEVFDRCDYALYNAKSVQRGKATLFSLRHETMIRSDRAVEAALQAADFDAEMDVHFQPIVDLRNDAVVAVEALARWTSPSLGQVRPDQFIILAERAGLIHRLTLALFCKALSRIGMLPPTVRLSFNLSAQDITSSETILSMVGAIRRSGVDPRRICLELTETAVMRDFDAAREAIALLRALGVTIALDDFGTGYSSLGYLHRLAFDKVKLDRSFVFDLDSPSGGKIVAAIFALCANLDLDCVVEGVESPHQLARLRALGCTFVQGYLIARPMPIEACRDWIASRPAGAARIPDARARARAAG